ncbi:MAG: NAD(P)H-dependent oxidoreductase subunit E [Ilumatobacteraceae bacterium]
MDLRFPDAEPTLAEVQALDAVLGASSVAEGWEREHGGAHRADALRHLLLRALHALQDRVGWISPGGLGEISRRLDVPPADAYGVASFYAMFALEQRPLRTVHVCSDLACQTRGAVALIEAVDAACGPPNRTLDRSHDGATWQPSPCLGLCERAPAVLVTEAGSPAREAVVAPATADDVAIALRIPMRELGSEAAVVAAVPQAAHAATAHALVLLKRVGIVDPSSVDSYRANGGYLALRAAVEMGPAAVIREVTESGLVGRGGAAFPAGRKWAAVAAQPVRTRYLVCNADESEPGTFKDRVIIEGDPYSLIESMTIAAYATGVEEGFVYLRGEYPRARETLEHALAEARRRGLLGPDVMGLGFAFDIEIVRGAGAYICGEETAIFSSIEGYRGEPRSKPPFPVEVGLFAKPTVVNNVETLVNVLPIILGGGAAFAAVGTAGSTGTKIFCVSGNVVAPGVYEVPFGATLREVIELAGGVPGGRSIRAVLMGGAAGSFVRGDEIDFALTLEGARAHNTTLGSGVVMVLDDSVDIPVFLRRIAAFFRDESCGQCVPCRIGTVRQEEAMIRLTSGTDYGSGSGSPDIQLVRDVGQVMRDASICGLGQTAWNAIESAIDRLGALQ